MNHEGAPFRFIVSSSPSQNDRFQDTIDAEFLKKGDVSEILDVSMGSPKKESPGKESPGKNCLTPETPKGFWSARTPTIFSNRFRHFSRSMIKTSSNSESTSNSYKINPFEDVDSLDKTTLSPSLFCKRTPRSRSETPDSCRWSIGQLSALYPAEIDESEMQTTDSLPSPQEAKAQKAIEKFWKENLLVVPSPNLVNRKHCSYDTPTKTTNSFTAEVQQDRFRKIMAQVEMMNRNVSEMEDAPYEDERAQTAPHYWTNSDIKYDEADDLRDIDMLSESFEKTPTTQQSALAGKDECDQFVDKAELKLSNSKKSRLEFSDFMGPNADLSLVMDENFIPSPNLSPILKFQ